jgi:hypothetical protein
MTDIPREAIEKAVKSKLASHGLDRIETKAGFDHDGDPALFVYAVLAPNSPLVPGEVSAAANVALNDALGRIGDQPFAYLYIQHPDDERPEDAPYAPEFVSQ